MLQHILKNVMSKMKLFKRTSKQQLPNQSNFAMTVRLCSPYLQPLVELKCATSGFLETTKATLFDTFRNVRAF